MALFNWRISTLFAGHSNAGWHQRLLVSILANGPGYGRALLGVDVFLDLLGLASLLQVADFLLLVATALSGSHEWSRFTDIFADTFGTSGALLDSDGTGSLVAFGVLGPAAVDLGLTVGVSGASVARIGRVIAAATVVAVASIAITAKSRASRDGTAVAIGVGEGSVAVELSGGAASAVKDCIFNILALWVVDVDALGVLLEAHGSIVDGVADSLVDSLALLDDDGHLDGLKLNVLLQGTPLLSHIETFADLFGAHNGTAILVSDIGTSFTLGCGTGAFNVALAVVLLHVVEVRSASGFLSSTIAITATRGVSISGSRRRSLVGGHDPGRSHGDEQEASQVLLHFER